MRFFIVILFALILWDLVWPLFGVGQMAPWTLMKRIEQGRAPLLVDVRTPAEFNWFHIPGAINIPFGTKDSFERILELTRKGQGREIVVICMTGHRSPVQAYRLQRMGVEAVNLTWGMVGWSLFGGQSVGGE